VKRLELDLKHAHDKLDESAKLLESNQHTITWLNKELNAGIAGTTGLWDSSSRKGPPQKLSTQSRLDGGAMGLAMGGYNDSHDADGLFRKRIPGGVAAVSPESDQLFDGEEYSRPNAERHAHMASFGDDNLGDRLRDGLGSLVTGQSIGQTWGQGGMENSHNQRVSSSLPVKSLGSHFADAASDSVVDPR